MESKIYTVKEMRDVADFFDSNIEVIKQKVLSNAILANIYEAVSMLRQAADTEKRIHRKYDATLNNIEECPNNGEETVYAN